jgi:hypothetical protein
MHLTVIVYGCSTSLISAINQNFHQLTLTLISIIIQWLYPGCDTALISYHGQASNFESDAQIKHHRDTSFASPTARMLNLGNVAHFSYNHYRRNNDPTACTNYLLNPGDLVQFDCKHLHACTYAASERISLVMWQLNKLKLFIG